MEFSKADVQEALRLKNKIIMTSERLLAAESAVSVASFDFIVDVGHGYFKNINEVLDSDLGYADYIVSITPTPGISISRVNNATRIWSNIFQQLERNEKKTVRYIKRFMKVAKDRFSYITHACSLDLGKNGEKIIDLAGDSSTIEIFMQKTQNLLRWRENLSAARKVSYDARFMTDGGTLDFKFNASEAKNLMKLVAMHSGVTSIRDLSDSARAGIVDEAIAYYLRHIGTSKKRNAKKSKKSKKGSS